jgi:hypothetical protein
MNPDHKGTSNRVCKWCGTDNDGMAHIVSGGREICWECRRYFDNGEPYELPPHVRAEVQRILDAEARKKLQARIDHDRGGLSQDRDG